MINTVLEPAVAINFFASLKTDSPFFKRDVLNIILLNKEIHTLFGGSGNFKFLPIKQVDIDIISTFENPDYQWVPGDLNTSRVNLLKYSFDNDLWFTPYLHEYNIEDYLIDVSNTHPDCLNHAKKSLLINNLVDFYCFFEFPDIENSLSDELLSEIGNFKESNFYEAFADGLIKISENLDGHYHLTDENIRFLRKSLTKLEGRIVEITKQENLVKVDIDALLGDGLSILSSGILPGLPLGTLKELFEKISNIREFKETPELRFCLALSILKKTIASNVEDSDISTCPICKISIAEIEQLNEEQCHELLHNSVGEKCIKHSVSYLDGRKKHRLIGKGLLKFMKQ
ncbi:hypothetical protein [Fodinibius halophilus]|uniref:Uncharacterized protein n=1 Tax=Fodinibius halophilus TaxID=1736908 RepID=A0A6M1THL5_9BACT|nr:hypothetical protein [Fodinibius halophilus]NGP90224.1 hypothetical protein [Fodinibius halophilus]